MPYIGSRNADEQRMHDAAVLLIAKERYKFYDKTAYTNLNIEHNMSAGIANGAEQYPDIVVVDDFTKKPRIIAEVETESTVNEIELRQWNNFVALELNFYLYVPSSAIDRAIEIIDSERLRGGIFGLRRYDMADNKIQIANIW